MASTNVDELAEDYKSSLEDLTFNSRWEITNLTVIAKENIHAAQAISKVIEDHIQQTTPARKLPSLYLLDSVAKNVGTPYTLFFGRNLYRTFMDAYSLVDPQIRRKLEEMLQTWKQPVPGSPSATPVFPSEITRRIDNALIKARTAAVQAQQKQMKEDQAKFGINRPSSTTPSGSIANIPYRSTPTPPNANVPPFQSGIQAPQEQSLGTSSMGSTQMNPIAVQHLATQLPLPLNLKGPPSPSIDSLYNDVDALVKSTQQKFSETPFDPDIQKKLKALLDLKTLLSTQTLPPDQLAVVREQVSKLANPPAPLPVSQPPPFQLPLMPFPGGNVPNLASLLSAMPLATNSQSQPMAGILNIQSAPPPPPPPPPPLAGLTGLPSSGTGGSDLFSSLLSAGLITPQGQGPKLPVPPINPASMLSSLLSSGVPRPPVPNSEPDRHMLAAMKLADVELTSASLKQPRPHLLPILNESLPSRCSSCARRFEDSDQGKKEKASHLDWHFRVHQRLTENARRGQNRSWYVGEEDWIKSRDDDDDNTPANTSTGAAENNLASGNTISSSSKQTYMPVPNDPTLSNAVCPICQEKFEPIWHNEAEEWVWMDAVNIDGRIYHESCRAEVAKGGGTLTPRSRGSTPDIGSLGKDGGGKTKRKAEDSASVLGKTKRERI